MSSVAIYGAGRYGGALCEALRSEGYDVEFFLDEYCELGDKDGVLIFRPTDAPRKDITVYISIPERNEEIREKLLSLGFCDIRSFGDSITQIKDVFLFFAKLDLLWLVENRAEMVDEEKIARFSNLLKDEKSRDILSRIVAFRKSLDSADYVYPDGEEEYFTKEIDPLSQIDGGLRFVDAGAYTGDTLLSVCKHRHNIEFAASFEPDRVNFSKLKETAKTLTGQGCGGFFALYPMGLWSKSDILEFSMRGTSSSRIAKGGDKNIIQIPVCSIDETLFAVAPNFIKMDIEGAEMEALMGAKECIRAYTPILAICLYHRPSDLWEIPLLIEDILPGGYDMYLRVHEHMGLSTVLYCLPKKRK